MYKGRSRDVYGDDHGVDNAGLNSHDHGNNPAYSDDGNYADTCRNDVFDELIERYDAPCTRDHDVLGGGARFYLRSVDGHGAGSIVRLDRYRGYDLYGGLQTTR